MSDVPPPLPTAPAVGTRLDASIFEQARQPAAEAVQAAQAPPAAPAPAPSGLNAEDLLAQLPPSLTMSGTGTVQRRFRSRRAADTIRLVVDDAVYLCSGSAPADLLVEALDAHQAKNQGRLMVTMRKLVLGVLLPEDRVRYEARLAGAVTETADGSEADLNAGAPVTVIGVPGSPVALPPVDIVDMIAHGLWLVGTYFGERPTQPSGSSGFGQ